MLLHLGLYTRSGWTELKGNVHTWIRAPHSEADHASWPGAQLDTARFCFCSSELACMPCGGGWVSAVGKGSRLTPSGEQRPVAGKWGLLDSSLSQQPSVVDLERIQSRGATFYIIPYFTLSCKLWHLHRDPNSLISYFARLFLPLMVSNCPCHMGSTVSAYFSMSPIPNCGSKVFILESWNIHYSFRWLIVKRPRRQKFPSFREF